MTYEQAFKDHKYLWCIGPGYDMTGGYVDQEDLWRLLKSPTKKTARECLLSQIDHWFSVGPDDGTNPNQGGDAREYIRNDPKVKEIAERTGNL